MKEEASNNILDIDEEEMSRQRMSVLGRLRRHVLLKLRVRKERARRVCKLLALADRANIISVSTEEGHQGDNTRRVIEETTNHFEKSSTPTPNVHN